MEQFGLFGEKGPQRDYEEAAFKRINLDLDGERACNLCEVWAIQNINKQSPDETRTHHVAPKALTRGDGVP